MKTLCIVSLLFALGGCAIQPSPFPSCVKAGQALPCDDGLGGGEAGGGSDE